MTTNIFCFLRPSLTKHFTVSRPGPSCSLIDPFTVDRTGDSNGVFETMRREILDFRTFWLSSHIARFLYINELDPDENLTGPT